MLKKMAHCHISIQKFEPIVVNCFLANVLDTQDLVCGSCIPQV